MGGQPQSYGIAGDAAPGRRNPASRRGLHLPALVAAGVGLLLSVIASYAIGQREHRVTRVEFEGVAATELIVLQNGINEYLSRLLTLRTLFESANEEVTRREFEVFSSRRFENSFVNVRATCEIKILCKDGALPKASGDRPSSSSFHFKAIAAG